MSDNRLRYVDVLRGLAIITVLVHHLPSAFGTVFGAVQVMGGRGVDLFFVLSGFLIGTTCLARADLGRTPGAQTAAYWVLRSARIWPLYLVLLALIAIGVSGVDPEATRIVRMLPGYYLFFLSNDVAQSTLELGVLWSLAIEEQFYLAVGLVLLFASRSRAQLAGAFVAMGTMAVLVSLRARFDLVQLQRFQQIVDALFTYRTYHSTLARLDQLGLGLIASAAAAAFNASKLATSVRGARATSWAAVVAVALVLVYLPQFGPLEFTVVGVLFAAGVLWLQRPAARQLAIGRVEGSLIGLIGWVGQLSFGLYLIHPFVRSMLLSAWTTAALPFTRAGAVGFFAAWLVVTAVLAALSYRFLETPVLGWAREVSGRLMGRARPPAAIEVLPAPPLEAKSA